MVNNETFSTTESTEAAEIVAATAENGSVEASEAPAPEPSLPVDSRFLSTSQLLFVAPDVPPIPPRPRRSEMRRLDDILDREFGGDADQGEADGRRRGRSGDAQNEDAPRRSDRQGRSDRGDRSERGDRHAQVVTEPQRVKGSTRLEAKRQRRRDGRDTGRRRTVVTESEFLARREAVDREMVVRTSEDRVQIGVLEDKVLVEHYVARSSETSLIGNVYLGRVQNVLPSMEAAFVDIGRGRNAVLYSGEVDWSEIDGGNTARRIENALKPGDTVLVQVTKDPVGHKGARLTSQISLPGRFLVYVPGGAMNGISRKLPDTERARLKKILKSVLPSGAGVIVRTAAEGASEDQLTRDVQRLTKQWESIQKRVERGGGPAMLHSEPDMLIKIVRDVFNEDFHKLVISGEDTFRTIEEYLSQVAPDLTERVERFVGDRDVFSEYRVTEQIQKALDRKVWLPSGGSLVIDRTEAMTVIDVNTGKFVGEGGNLEETVTKNNLEAAEEIVRQLRLRDIGGIIVIDFIDMVLESNRDLVQRRLIECLSRDRTKHQVAEVTSLGLVQMTRKKLGLGLLESFSEPCSACAARGVIVHHEPVVRTRSESPSRGSRRGKNASSVPASKAKAPEPKAQTHEITDGAKNMLAQVAASTIVKAEEELPPVDEPAPKRSRKRASAAAPAARAAASPKGDVGEAREQGDPASLLDSVLDALPEPPEPRKQNRRRRVSTSTIRTGDTPDSARAAEQVLDAALGEL